MTSFYDDYLSSPSMREYLRLTAKEQPAKPIEKTASVQDLVPTSLNESLLLLTSKLRDQGFSKHANELEQRFLLLKKAERHLYNTHDETGEDFVEFAHPGGGNKDLDSEWGELGEVEDIVERHQKMLAVVNKTPSKSKTVKEAAAQITATPTASVASIAKVILAQDAGDVIPPANEGVEGDASIVDPIEQKAYTYFQELVSRTIGLVFQIERNEKLSDWTYAGGQGDEDLLNKSPMARSGLSAIKSTKGHFDGILENLNEMATAHPSQEVVSDLQGNLNFILLLIRKAKFISGSNKTNYMKTAMKIESLAENVLRILRSNPSQANQKSQTDAAAAPAATAPVSPNFDSTFASGMKNANAFLSSLSEHEAKANGDANKLDILHKTESNLRTFINELQSLYAGVKAGENFAVAAGKTTMFRTLKSADQLQGDINGFFAAAMKVVDYMKTW